MNDPRVAPAGSLPLSGELTGSFEQALTEGLRRLSSQLSVDAACAAALDVVATLFGASASWLMLHDPERDVLRTVLYRGSASAVYGGVALPVRQGALSRLAFDEDQWRFIADVRREGRWFDPARVHASGLRSVLMLPLRHEEQRVGLLGLDSPRFTEASPPTEDDLARLEAVAGHAALAIANAQRFEAVESDRDRLRSALQERSGPRDAYRDGEAAPDIVGHRIVLGSAGFAEAMDQAVLVARADTTVLLCGETGTGKEVVARVVHDRSSRRRGPFVALNCAALPEGLVESELFGHERGAFTGAVARRPGAFELAHGGTLFLDEVGDLPLEAQAKLLRVLQDREVRRVGATAATRVDARVIAASNRDLAAAISTATFRPDLFYRLSVFPIRLPPLRERLADIAPLARHFLGQFARRQGRRELTFTEAALARLTEYSWPGNVRELQNVIERAVILSHGPVVDADALVLPVVASADRAPTGSTDPPPADALATLPAAAPGDAEPPVVRTLAEADRTAILAALEAADWRISGRGGAADALGVKPTTLHGKMRRLGIRRPRPSDLSRALRRR